MIALLLPLAVLSQAEPRMPELVADYLWSDDEATRHRAAAIIDTFPPSSRQSFRELERALDRGRPDYLEYPGERAVHALSVELPDGRTVPVLVLLPPGYDPEKRWPTLLAMHGGPVSNPARALDGAKRMLSVWLDPAAEAGWILVAPAMTHVVARAPRTETRLPYEILRPEQMEAVVAEIGRRYHIDPDRTVSTGISLGSNFSIAYAASRPDRFSAIVPVSTEGDSRETLLRNLIHVPAFILEGARDANIRDIEGPRALAAILESFRYDHVYKEQAERAHEGFQEMYPEVLRWLEARPRDPFPKELLRVPHSGIMPLARRVHWIESDTRQGLIHAAVNDNHIDVRAHWARRVTVYLHDALVDLDRDVTIRVNGAVAHQGRVERSIGFALEQVRLLDDFERPYAASVTVPVTGDGSELAERLAPRREPGTLSFWEMYASQDLEDRFPSLGIEGRWVSETAAIRLTAVDPEGPFGDVDIRPGDLLLEVGGEPFFDGRDLTFLRQWLLRELDGVPRAYDLVILRGGVRKQLTARLKLTEAR